MSPLFQTRITQLFGIRLPVLAGGMQWLSTPDYVAAAAGAGICGFLTAASYEELSDLRAAIRRCRDLSEGKPFGVNVSMLPKLVQGERTQGIFDLIIEEGVRCVETSGRNPAPYLPALKAAGVTVVHKVPAVKYALKAQAEGVDAVAVVGAECGGHPGMEMVGTMVQANVAAAKLSIPLLVGGGIGTGAHLVAALALTPKWDWDVAAGWLIATEAGARVSDHHGRPWAFNRPDPRQASLVCAAPVIQPMIVRRCKNVPLST